MTGVESHSVEYARRLYDEIVAWYQSADAKAQVALGIDGIFLGLMMPQLFSNPAALHALGASFSTMTWVCLSLMLVATLGSIASALCCLRSRIYSERLARQIITKHGLVHGAEVYSPAVMWFFQIISSLDRSILRNTLARANCEFELNAMASQIHILSRNVKTKHRFANIAFLCAGASLLLCVVSAVSICVSSLSQS